MTSTTIHNAAKRVEKRFWAQQMDPKAFPRLTLEQMITEEFTKVLKRLEKKREGE